MNSSTETINLLLIDDHEMFREGLARSFEREVGFRLVAQCATSSEALAFLAATREPVTVLLDVDLGKHRGWSLWRRPDEPVSKVLFSS